LRLSVLPPSLSRLTHCVINAHLNNEFKEKHEDEYEQRALARK